ncbi:p450 domain containing protein [Asbolus verrucosus]|uniref:p450 domain containing protein n=1 Tax=Asbolus verrucosus TaxID=1661398 RepID=A0A482W0T8_ASBVE|nr:p450 domain containing protein [Asbolus verrucosus]
MEDGARTANTRIHKWKKTVDEVVVCSFTRNKFAIGGTMNGEGYEAKELCSRFTLNNVANCAFDIEDKCSEEDNKAQLQLREEVVQNFADNNDKLPYDALQAMPYLDGVINETLRIYPPVFSLQRICTSSHTLTQENGKSATIENYFAIVWSSHGC